MLSSIGAPEVACILVTIIHFEVVAIIFSSPSVMSSHIARSSLGPIHVNIGVIAVYLPAYKSAVVEL